MRVTPLGINYKPSFGYSEKANKKLRQVLAKDPQVSESGTIPNCILRLSELCNGIENRIILQECGGRKPGIQYTIPELSDMLIGAKIQLTRLICTHYPKLDFLSQEMNDYEKGANVATLKGVSESENWRRELVKELTSPSGHFIVAAGEGIAAAKSQPGSKMSQKELESAASLLEEYKPDANSPKGFVDIKGMADLKEALREAVVIPIKDPVQAALDAKEYGSKYPNGIFLYGPPGCGKTYITKALAQEADTSMFIFRIGKVGSSFIHKTSENYELVFNYVGQKAKALGKPCILLIDEADSVTKSRNERDDSNDLEERATLLNLIQTARENNIIVVGLTNQYTLVDGAVKDRFDFQQYVGLPDKEAREALLMHILSQYEKGKTLHNSPEEISEIAKKLEGHCNRDIVETIAPKAAKIAKNDGRRDITLQDYITVIDMPDTQLLKVDESQYKPKNQGRKMGFGN